MTPNTLIRFASCHCAEPTSNTMCCAENKMVSGLALYRRTLEICKLARVEKTGA